MCVQGNPELGMLRTRDDSSGVFISAAHSAADRTTAPDALCGVGPGQYDVSNMYVLSPKRRTADIKFGSADRNAKVSRWGCVSTLSIHTPCASSWTASLGRAWRCPQNSYMSLQMAADPLATTAKSTPGPIYDPPSPTGRQAAKFGTGPRTYSPERGGAQAGPYLSRCGAARGCVSVPISVPSRVCE